MEIRIDFETLYYTCYIHNSFYFEIALKIQFTQEEWQSILFLPAKEDGISLDWPEKEVQRFILIFSLMLGDKTFVFLEKLSIFST